MFYGQSYNPYGQQINQTAPAQQIIKPTIGIYHVNNKQEAENWMVEPGQTVYLFDNTNEKFYIKSVANNGMINPLEIYSFHKENEVKEEKVEYVTREEFEQLKELLNEFTTTDTNAKK